MPLGLLFYILLGFGSPFRCRAPAVNPHTGPHGLHAASGLATGGFVGLRGLGFRGLGFRVQGELRTIVKIFVFAVP